MKPNIALQPTVGGVEAGASSRLWVLAPPSTARERWADGGRVAVPDG